MNQTAPRITAKSNLLALVTGLALLLNSLTAHATLGGDSSSVVQDQKALGATINVNTTDGYVDYALALPRGGMVHEFVNNAGQVFEITWSQHGSRPDMQQLLGSYATRFSGTSNGASPTSRRADRMDSDFELHSKLMNRYFSGTAHIPGSLPIGLTGPLAVPLEKSK